MRTILVDNYDSYSYNLYQLMASTYGVAPVVLTNDSPEWSRIDLDSYAAVVISPGPGRPETRRDTGVALDYLRDGRIPVLGVCLGHQALGWFSGAEVVSAPRPRHGHLERITHVGTDLFREIPQDFVAVRYHSLCLADPLPPQLQATAWAQDGVIMGLRHTELPWWGVQFHPESVATEQGGALLRNFGELASARRHRPTQAVLTAPRRRPPTVPVRSVCSAELAFEVSPELAFTELFADARYAFWLDSSRVEQGLSRFSFLGDAGGPCGEVLSAHVGTGRVDVRDATGTGYPLSGSIFEVLEARLRAGELPRDPALPFDLACGYVGYFGYEMKSECGSPNAHTAEQPDAQWMTASRMIAVDHETGRTWVLALSDGEPGSRQAARQWVNDTVARLRQMRGRRPLPVPAEPGFVDPELWLDRSRAEYLADIAECQRNLHAGESYEVCLTNTVILPFEGAPLETYRRLRARNPAPYAAYLRFDDLHVLCSSPERFLKIEASRTVESKPIKGTAPRDADPDRDQALRDGLAASPKTRAENLMIVDLLRNDLGRICEIGSVSVPRFMHVESYATVHQLVSTIRGVLRPDVSAVAAVRACFPGGSMTGAPKLRTMEIIDGLERRARGVYSGTLGFFGFQGTADLNIVIRTGVVHPGQLTVGAGGAIVLDSDPDEEFAEMIMKAAAVTQALCGADLPGALAGVPAGNGDVSGRKASCREQV